MSELKDRLRADLTVAMKARARTDVDTLRMALAAITNAEVAGDVARSLSDQDVTAVLTKEVRKRKEASEAFAGAGRTELAEKERAEQAVLERYLPQQLGDAEVSALAVASVAEVSAELGTAATMKQMGQVIKLAQIKAAGRADGGRIAAAVKAALSR